MNVALIVISLVVIYFLIGLIFIIERSRRGTDDQKALGKMIMKNPVIFISALIFWLPLMFVKVKPKED